MMKKFYMTISVVVACVITGSVLLTACGKNEVVGNIKTDTGKISVVDIKTDTKTEHTATAEITKATTEQTVADDATQEKNSPFALHGALRVDGTDLVDQNGKQYQLYGMSTHGLGWFPQYVSHETLTTLRDDWNTNCIRLAMYTAENGGYCTDGNQENLKQIVKNGIDYATELGMYVIVDWHVLQDENPMKYKDEAAKFFNEISRTYADQDNIIYEICNEPNGSTSWEEIKAYAETIIPIIRSNDNNAVILVGTPTWSQEIDKAYENPLAFDNIMYVAHFYAATHTDWLRDRIKKCINGGLPVFISEFGICDASGNGALDYVQADEWKKLIEEYNISYCCWNLANKNESSSVIASGCDKISDWTENELSEQGKWIVEWFRSEKNR